MLIKNQHKHHLDFLLEKEKFQVAAITVSTELGQVNVAAIYCPPNTLIKNEDCASLLDELGDKYIIGGDFNAKHTAWGSRLISPRGRILKQECLNRGCLFLTSGEPTHYPTDRTKTPDVIDCFIAKGISRNNMIPSMTFDLSSDHTPIHLKVAASAIKTENTSSLINNKTDWKKFRKILNESIDLSRAIGSIQELELEYEQLIKDVTFAARESTPTKKVVHKGYELPGDILELIKEKRRARRVWARSRFPQDKTILNRLTNQVSRRLEELQNTRTEKYLRGLTPWRNTDYSLWKLLYLTFYKGRVKRMTPC